MATWTRPDKSLRQAMPHGPRMEARAKRHPSGQGVAVAPVASAVGVQTMARSAPARGGQAILRRPSPPAARGPRAPEPLLPPPQPAGPGLAAPAAKSGAAVIHKAEELLALGAPPGYCEVVREPPPALLPKEPHERLAPPQVAERLPVLPRRERLDGQLVEDGQTPAEHHVLGVVLRPQGQVPAEEGEACLAVWPIRVLAAAALRRWSLAAPN